MVDMLARHLLDLHIHLKIVQADCALVHLGILQLLRDFDGREVLDCRLRSWRRPMTVRVVLRQLLDQLLQTWAHEVVANIGRKAKSAASAALGGTTLDHELNLRSAGLQILEVAHQVGERVEHIFGWTGTGGRGVREEGGVLEVDGGGRRGGGRCGGVSSGGGWEQEREEGGERIGEERRAPTQARARVFVLLEETVVATRAEGVGGGGDYDGDGLVALVAEERFAAGVPTGGGEIAMGSERHGGTGKGLHDEEIVNRIPHSDLMLDPYRIPWKAVLDRRSRGGDAVVLRTVRGERCFEIA